MMNPGSSVTAHLRSERYIDCYLLDYNNMARFASGSSLFSYISYGKGSLSVTFRPNKSDSYFFAFGHQSSSGNYSVTATYDLSFQYVAYDVSDRRYECSSHKCEFEDVEPDEIIVADNNYSTKYKCQMTLPDAIGIIPVVIAVVLGIVIVIVAVSCICPTILLGVLAAFLACFTCPCLRKKHHSSSVGEDSSLLGHKPEQPTTSAGTTTGGSFESPSETKTEYGTTPTPTPAAPAINNNSDAPPAYVADPVVVPSAPSLDPSDVSPEYRGGETSGYSRS